MSVVTATEARNTIDYVRVTAVEGTDYPIDCGALVRILETVVALEQRAELAEAKAARLTEFAAAVRTAWTRSSEPMSGIDAALDALDAWECGKTITLATEATARVMAVVKAARAWHDGAWSGDDLLEQDVTNALYDAVAALDLEEGTDASAE